MANIRYVGVLNITPDSFSDGGMYDRTETAITHAEELFSTGADLVDIGAESTNPWSVPLTADQEIARLAPILPRLIIEYGADTFSLDTYHPETLAWAVSQGLMPVLNDISGLHSSDMQQLVLRHNLSVIISHLPKSAEGTPTRAHTGKHIDSIDQVVNELRETAATLENMGISRSRIVLDPGIGFGKTMRLNWELLDFPSRVPNYDVMLGYSRKRFLHTTPDGIEIPTASALKTNAGVSPEARRAYDTWLSEQHQSILRHIIASNALSSQVLYLRLHEIPAESQ